MSDAGGGSALKQKKKFKKHERTAQQRQISNPSYKKNTDKYNNNKKQQNGDNKHIKHNNNNKKQESNDGENKEVPKKEYVDDEFTIRGMLQANTRHYFEQTLPLFEGQEDKQELRMLTQGVLGELKTQQVDVACKDSVAARVMEEMCRTAKASQLVEMMSLFKPYIQKLVGHSTASFVMQKYIISVSALIHKPDSKLVQPFIELLEELKGRWVSLIIHAKASFVVRAIIRLLGDLPQSDKNEESDYVSQPNESFHQVLRGIVDELLSGTFGTIYNCCLSINAAPCITALVIALKNDAEYYNKLVFEVLGAHETDYQRLAMHAREITANTASVRVIEALFNTCDDKTYDTLVKAFINKTFIKQAGESDGAKFILRAVQKNARDKAQVENLLDKLLENMDVMLKSGDNNGLIPAVFEIGVQWPEFQNKIITRVLNVACPEGQDIFATLINLGKPGANQKAGDTKSATFPALGTQLLKQIWNFNYDVKQVVIHSAMKTDGELLAKAAMSHGKILESMISDAQVPVSVARKILPRVASFVPKLAQDQYGSYFVEKLYEKVDFQTKMKLVGLLANIRDDLRTTPNGRVLIVKTHLDQYITNPKLWEKSMKKDATRMSFSDLTKKTEDNHEEEANGEDEPPSKKLKQTKQTNNNSKPSNSTNNEPKTSNTNNNTQSSKKKKKNKKKNTTKQEETTEQPEPMDSTPTQPQEPQQEPTTTNATTNTNQTEEGTQPKSNKKQISTNQAAFLASLKADLSDKKRKRENGSNAPDAPNATDTTDNKSKDK